jgi:hypothetical protein
MSDREDLQSSPAEGQNIFLMKAILGGLVKSHLGRHPGESRGPEHLEITGFRLSPEQ